jgi:hypothetical protein
LRQPLSYKQLDAVTLLLVFFPHRHVATAEELPWNEWAQEGMHIWQASSHNTFWESAWMCFFSRLSKHDTHVCAAPNHRSAVQTCNFGRIHLDGNAAHAWSETRVSKVGSGVGEPETILIYMC